MVGVVVALVDGDLERSGIPVDEGSAGEVVLRESPPQAANGTIPITADLWRNLRLLSEVS